MSRFCGEVETAPILDVAARWKTRCLIGYGSVFGDQLLWTEDGISALDTHFVQNLDEGEGGLVRIFVFEAYHVV